MDRTKYGPFHVLVVMMSMVAVMAMVSVLVAEPDRNARTAVILMTLPVLVAMMTTLAVHLFNGTLS